ncbi:MAG: hypothetical protein KDC39_11655 [Actinobacteria bacterium]|nr:hypothetical protein [Actinomycetota bacterium]
MPVPSCWNDMPDNAVLLHVGPRKTGTTALQSAFANARGDLKRLGISYPGHDLNQRGRIRKMLRGGEFSVGAGGQWPGRVVLSDETCDYLTFAAARTIAERIGRQRLAVLITARPMARQLPSVWQQKVKRGNTDTTLADWLTDSLSGPSQPLWWRVDRMADTWRTLLGPDRVFVLLLDEEDHQALFRDVERLLDLPPDLLHPSMSNRGLTLEETEAVRQLNLSDSRAIHGTAALDDGVNRLVETRVPHESERRPKLPGWARSQVWTLQQTIVEGLRSQPNVIGDLDSWATRRDSDFTDDEQDVVDLRQGPRLVPSEAVTLLASPEPALVASPAAGGQDLASVPASALLSELWSRLVGRLIPGRSNRAKAEPGRALGPAQITAGAEVSDG